MAISLLMVLFLGPMMSSETTSFFNVILSQGADPWMLRHTDGMYYLCVTTGRDVTLRRASTISGIAGGEQRIVWAPGPGDPCRGSLWAPELHRLRGAWYVYVAANGGVAERHRMFVLENRADDPFTGRFESKGMLADPAADRWAIDGTVFELWDRLYAVWSGWEGEHNVSQQLYIAPMRDPWTIAGPRVELSRPEHPWECHGEPRVNEGPQVVIRDRTINLVYSASGSWTDQYCLGLLTASATSNPLDPASWTKRTQPIFASARGVTAPGHCSFTESPDGTEPWIIYHAARYPGSGWARSIRAQRFSWSSDGTPALGEPIGTDQSIPVPSGEPARRRIDLTQGTCTGATKIIADPQAPTGTRVVFADGAAGSLTVRLKVPTSGPYLVSIHSRNSTVDGAGRGASAVQEVLINDMATQVLHYPCTSREGWSNAFVRVDLSAGTNSLRFGTQQGAVDITGIEVLAMTPVALP